MISKIKSLNNLAVFNGFDWDSEVINSENQVLELKKTNIIYGRNYSGKTTLSRVLRAMELGEISDKYENPECCISVLGDNEVTHDDFSAHNKVIRVFNEDFIKQNLNFIANPEENVQPFAILGGDNNLIEEEIKNLKDKLGSDEKDLETALYKDLKSLDGIYSTAKKSHEKAQSALYSQLNEKAIGRQTGIKYNPEKFGDQNYTNTKLRNEIQLVRKEEFKPLSDERKALAVKILEEKKKKDISEISELDLSFPTYSRKAKELVIKPIAQSNKIEGLLKNAILNKWVKEGRELHKNKLKTCAFCDNKIESTRWDQLEKHFDEESDKLENSIVELISEIKEEKKLLNTIEISKREEYYAKYAQKFDDLKENLNSAIVDYQNSLDSLIDLLEARKNDILNVHSYVKVNDHTSKIETALEKIEELRIKSNAYSEKLNTDQGKAKKALRLREIYDFITTIKYDEQIDNIADLHSVEKEEKRKRDEKKGELDEILSSISMKQKALKDESKGAEKVNEYLNSHFGHKFLTLKAIEFEDVDTGQKRYRFEIHREGKKAHHLSEGEISLIAFCYFMAKLQEVGTKGNKPIIWIDDPISSLDSNHIFFIYTLINTQIFGKDDFEQLFISTHNLNFLKYLKRLPGATTTKESKTKYRYLLIQRNDRNSVIKLMPNFLRDYVTEFNYLFEQIYRCSKMESVNDTNYTAFYNFGNSARKFLELYLYYKYPDASSQIEKMKKFFGTDDIPVVLTDRINNEYSHLSGAFERGETVIEVPEMNTTAKLIIERIKQDDGQYQALLNSIGENITEASF